MAWYWWLIVLWTCWAAWGFRYSWINHDVKWWAWPIVFLAMYIWQPTMFLMDVWIIKDNLVKKLRKKN